MNFCYLKCKSIFNENSSITNETKVLFRKHVIVEGLFGKYKDFCFFLF